MDTNVNADINTPLENKDTLDSESVKPENTINDKKKIHHDLSFLLHQINSLNDEKNTPKSNKRGFLDMNGLEDGSSKKRKLHSKDDKEETSKSSTPPSSLLRKKQKGNISMNKAFSRCKILIEKIMKHEFSIPFLEPVDTVALGIPDYFDVVKTPMDLGTIKARLDSKYYKTIHEFCEDTRLVWQNAMSYNHPKSNIYKMAQSLSITFEEHFPKILKLAEQTPQQRKRELELKFLELQDSMKLFGKNLHDIRTHGLTPSTSQPKERSRKVDARLSKPMSFEEKSRLSQAINNLAPQYLSGVFSIIDEEIPHALKTDSSEVELDIDSLAPVVLRRLESYIRTAGVL